MLPIWLSILKHTTTSNLPQLTPSLTPSNTSDWSLRRDAETARSAAKRAHHALTLAATYTDHVTRTATSAGEALADRDDLTIDAVVASAILPNPIVVDATLAATWQANVDTARAAAFKRVREFPTKLSELFDNVSGQVIDIAAQLGDVDTPQAVLDAGLGEPWQKLMALKQEMNVLIELRTELRSFGLIPEAQPYNSGWHWDLRHEYPAGRFKPRSTDLLVIGR